MNKSPFKKLTLASLLFFISLSSSADGLANLSRLLGIPEVPKIPAFLPTMDQVPASQPMPIDGTWLLPIIGKKIRIDSGRAYAVDGWLHLFVLDIQPGMVVWKDIVPTGPGQYAGDELPLAGRLTAKVGADRSMSVSVAGMFGPVNFKAIPIQLNNENWYGQEMQAAGVGGQQFGGHAQRGYQVPPPPNSMGQQYNNQQQQRQFRQPSPNGWQQQQNNQQGNSQYSPSQNGNNSQRNRYQTQYNPNTHNNQYQSYSPSTYESAQVQDSSKAARIGSANQCEESVYDPDTDTTSCYTEGENQ